MPPELEAAIDAWIDGQPEPKPSRSEAIRRLIEKGLSADGRGVNPRNVLGLAAWTETPFWNACGRMRPS
jgi:metal-responsive CopG/Arc/MetJ family transcriptional regulator